MGFYNCNVGHYRTDPDDDFDASSNTRDADYLSRGYQGELKDLEGNVITKAGWYDFTRLPSENGVAGWRFLHLW